MALDMWPLMDLHKPHNITRSTESGWESGFLLSTVLTQASSESSIRSNLARCVLPSVYYLPPFFHALTKSSQTLVDLNLELDITFGINLDLKLDLLFYLNLVNIELTVEFYLELYKKSTKKINF